MRGVTDKPLSAQPNAGLPRDVQGRQFYMGSPEYMAEFSRRFVQVGAKFVGGCCGTTPTHIKLIADGNKYAAGVTSLGDKDVRIIIREIYQDPRNYGKVSFPSAAKSTDLRPYTKGTLVREEMELEEELEEDEEEDEIEDLDRVLPQDVTTDEAFEEEPDELDES